MGIEQIFQLKEVDYLNSITPRTSGRPNVFPQELVNLILIFSQPDAQITWLIYVRSSYILWNTQTNKIKRSWIGLKGVTKSYKIPITEIPVSIE